MRKMKKLLALLMALAMVVTAFAACGTPAASESSKTEASKTEESKTEESTAEVLPTGEKHPCRIVQPGILPVEYDAGIAAVNEKLAADGVDIEVSVTRIPWDAYAEKLNLMLTTGEEFELLHIMQDVKNISAVAGMGAILPVGEYQDKYPELWGKFSDLEWKGTLYNGEQFAIPCYWQSFDITMSYMTYRTDIAEKVGVTKFPDTTEGIIDLMQKSQSEILNENGIKAYSWMHQIQDTAHWLHRGYDSFPFYVENSLGLILSRQDGTIDSFYESDEFKNDANTYYDMYQKGLVNPDILSLDSQKKYDDADFGGFLPSQTFDPNQSVATKEKSGLETTTETVRTWPEKPDMVYTFVQNLNAISSTSENPENGLKFLNWLYGKEENHDLFHYGIEGTHYTKNAEGRIDQVKGEDGAAIYNLDTWMTGYLPWIKWSETVLDKRIEYANYKSDNYVVSPIAGFIFDSSEVTAELTNLQTEIIASIYPIKLGMVSYEENIGPAIEKLKAAGLDKYLEVYRAQFAKYLEANPNVLTDAKGTAK